MIIIGQDYPASILYGIKNIQNWAVILCEPTALGLDSKDPADRKFSTSQLMTNFEEVLYQIEVKKQKTRISMKKPTCQTSFSIQAATSSASGSSSF